MLKTNKQLFVVIYFLERYYLLQAMQILNQQTVFFLIQKMNTNFLGLNQNKYQKCFIFGTFKENKRRPAKEAKRRPIEENKRRTIKENKGRLIKKYDEGI